MQNKIKFKGGISLQANLNQLSMTDIYSTVDEYFQQDKPKLIKLFEQYIDLHSLIPQSFFNHYYSKTGHTRDYPLTSMISALIIKSILSIIKRTNFMIKYQMALSYTKLNNTTSLKSELVISAITQQIILLISNSIKQTKHLLPIKKLVA